MNEQPTLGIIGAGKVGTSLGVLLAQCGYTVAALASRDLQHAQHLAGRLNSAVAHEPHEVLLAADLTLLTVPDDAIADIAQGLGRRLGSTSLTNHAVVHTSGSRGAELLEPLAMCGAAIGSLHPAFPFTDAAVTSVAGATFAIEANTPWLHDHLTALVDALGGISLSIPTGMKPLYHAALVFAGNYMVVLYAVAERLFAQFGADKAAAKSALLPLMQGSLGNLSAQDVSDALPGPLVRGDVGTISAHLAALDYDPEILALYRALALAALPLAHERGVDTAPLRATIDIR